VSALATAPLELLPHTPRAHPAESRSGAPGGPLTLEERLELELGAALADRPAACPVCGGRMVRAGEAEARCGDCGTTLS
jgi:tRNA(Ile2) C34 agmatinyltransferase TiaS